jgi:hypothetical protein
MGTSDLPPDEILRPTQRFAELLLKHFTSQNKCTLLLNVKWLVGN